MSIKVIFDSYSDICRYYMYGRSLLDLPEKVIDRLNEHFDGMEFKQFVWSLSNLMVAILTI